MNTMRKPVLLAVMLCVTATFTATNAEANYKRRGVHLGPTGIIAALNDDGKDFQVESVEKGGPAEGKLKKGDIVVSVNGRAFGEHVRKEFAAAIDASESEAMNGKMTLGVQAAGTTEATPVELQLQVLGSYSATAPHNCPKTDKIITNLADFLTNVSPKDDLLLMRSLGLLATGEKKYFRKPTFSDEFVDLTPEECISIYRRNTWQMGYANLAACEYYLATGDKSILPAIKNMSISLGMGSDTTGLYGHCMAPLDRNPHKHGYVNGYGQMNQASLPALISLVLARVKIGIKHPDIDYTIRQSYRNYKYYVGKGALPYGVHNPWTHTYNNNGTSALAAIYMSLLGNQEGAKFFGTLAAADTDTLVHGVHVGNVWSQAWTSSGGTFIGPQATQSFFKRALWRRTLDRCFDGSFAIEFIGSRGQYLNKPPLHETATSVQKISPNGALLIAYCVGRNAIYCTGKGAGKSNFLNAEELAFLDGIETLDYNTMPIERLKALRTHELPQVTRGANWVYRERWQEHGEFESVIIPAMAGAASATDKDLIAAYAGEFGYRCPAELFAKAEPALVKLLRDKNANWEARANAFSSINFNSNPKPDDMATCGAEIYAAGIKAWAATPRLKSEPDASHADMSMTKRLLPLCADPYAAGLLKSDTDKAEFYSVVNRMLDNKMQDGRGQAMELISGIPLEDLPYVADRFIRNMQNKERTKYTYSAMRDIGAGAVIMARLQIGDGLDYLMDTFEEKTGKWGFKLRSGAKSLPAYGAYAQKYLEEIKALGDGKGMGNARKAIENATEVKEMMTWEEALKKAKTMGGR
jgi:hypothetical protein